MIKYTSLMCILILMGCSTTQQVSQTGAKAETFTRDMSAASLDGFDKSDCRTPKAKFAKLKWKDLVKEANSCVAGSKWKSVEDLGSEMAQRDINSPWGPYFLALHAESESQYERSLWLLELSIKRASQVGLFQYQKGRVLWRREEFKEATDSLMKAIQLDTNLIDAHLFLGQIFFRDQDYSRAARHFQAVLRVRPKDPTALMGLAECQIQTGDARGALEYLERGDRHYSSEPTFKLRQAYVHETMMNDVPTAIEIYKSVAQGYQAGKYTRSLEFSLSEKIRDLEISIHGNRSMAGSAQHSEVAK